MDHRCLYGHRVPDSYRYAIAQRLCPTCGAQTVTVGGYQLARRLAEDVPLEALAAFEAVRIVEETYVLQPKEEKAERNAKAPKAAPPIEEAQEVELSQEVPIAALAETEEKRTLALQSPAPQLPEAMPAPAADPTEEAVARPADAVASPLAEPESDPQAVKAAGFDPEEDDFFRSDAGEA